MSHQSLMPFFVLLMLNANLCAQSLDAPPGMFKELDDQIAGDALIICGKQLFIDDHLIEELNGTHKVLNQPVKHANNPLIIADKPWEGQFSFSSIIYDAQEGFYKMWYGAWATDAVQQALCYATSPDGIHWRKPVTTPWRAQEKNNIVFGPTHEFNCAGLFKDPTDIGGERAYKMMYSDYFDKTSASASTNVAYSPDGIHWVPEPANPLIPFSDSHCAPFWDARQGRYVAYLRYGPPNDRLISRIESEDFIHWSPKVTVLNRTSVDRVFDTKLYSMQVTPYAGAYFGLITTYHGETIQPIPQDQLDWQDKLDVQLAFSRNGYTWARVIGKSLLEDAESNRLQPTPQTWQRFVKEATFLPLGVHGKDWDWGMIYPLQAPLVVGDEIRFYYVARTGRHWAGYHGDTTTTAGIGLATLRLDGFISVEADSKGGTLTTKPLIFIGDVLEINADAAGGVIKVEAMGIDGKVIPGFSRADCQPVNVDSVRHILKWNDNSDAHLLQAQPIRLRFYISNAKLYSFTPRTLHNHYIPSYQ